MTDYKKSKEHLTNASLASPLAFLAGGPAGAIAVLGLGKLLDYCEDKDFEKRQLEWATNPNRIPELTPEEQISKINNDNKLRKGLAQNLPQFEDAIEIRGCANYKNEKETYIKVEGSASLAHTRTGIGFGKVAFYNGAWEMNSYKKIDAELHYNTSSFIEKFLDDYKKYGNKIKTYKIVASMYKKGTWMYTIDSDKSYIVCL